MAKSKGNKNAKVQYDVTLTRDGKDGRFYRLTTQCGSQQSRTLKTLKASIAEVNRYGGVRSIEIPDDELKCELEAAGAI